MDIPNSKSSNIHVYLASGLESDEFGVLVKFSHQPSSLVDNLLPQEAAEWWEH